MDWITDQSGGGAIDLKEGNWLRGEVTGTSLRGTWSENNDYRGLAPGSHKENSCFWIGAGKGEVKRVLLTESAIDALSLAVLDHKRTETQGVTLYLSTDGSGTFPIEVLRHLLDRQGQFLAAFDSDRSGEEMSWRIAQQLPGVGRITPAYGKDWNEQLIHDGHPNQINSSELDKQTLRSLWQWHQAAKFLGRPEAYLRRITEVARESLQGQNLSATAEISRKQDLQLVQQRSQLEM